VEYDDIADILHRVLGTMRQAFRTLWHTTSSMGVIDRMPHAFHHVQPPCIIPDPTGTLYSWMSCQYDALPSWDDCSRVRAGCVFSLLRSFPFLVNPGQRASPSRCLSPRVWVSSHTPMRRQAPNVWVSHRRSDTPSQDLRALVGKCFAISPIMLSTGSARRT
jgi:hypothetical protein